MEGYISIGEFAKTRNISLKALRYYEKTGVLKPEYVDPETNYRYYGLQQLMILDAIVLCRELEMPLSILKDYTNAEGELEFKKLLRDGKSIAMKRRQRLDEQLTKIEITLERFEVQSECRQYKGIYSRKIRERRIISLSCNPKMTPLEYENGLSKLFVMAQKNGIDAIFPHGMLFKYTGNELETSLFLETMHTDEENPLITVIPAGLYKCYQNSQDITSEPREVFKDYMKTHGSAISLNSSIPNELFRNEDNLFEMQVFDEDFWDEMAK